MPIASLISVPLQAPILTMGSDIKLEAFFIICLMAVNGFALMEINGIINFLKTQISIDHFRIRRETGYYGLIHSSSF